MPDIKARSIWDNLIFYIMKDGETPILLGHSGGWHASNVAKFLVMYKNETFPKDYVKAHKINLNGLDSHDS